MNVCYIWDDNLIEQCNRLPAVPQRASLVNNLITAYNLTKHLKVVCSKPASYSDLKEFHSELYLDHLKNFLEIDEEYMSDAQDEEYGIGYDCPPVSNMYELISTVAGGSITAAKCLVLGLADVAINWCGGWHHAQRFGADGFCYVNDIVLAIEKLRSKFPKVLYVDLDVHHGNGVQDAYNLSKSVFTLSFHKFEPGFYPGTGGIEDIGTLTAKGYSCNVPLNAAYSDNTLLYVFEKVLEKVHSLFAPDAIVVQCGADALAHDPHGGASLSITGYCSCVSRVLDKRKPTILLGGGGYNFSNTARLWVSLTALVIGVKLDEDIPEHEFWTKYGPDYTLPIQPTLTRDTNKKTDLDSSLATIMGNLDKYLGDAVVNKLEIERQNSDQQEKDKTKEFGNLVEKDKKMSSDINITTDSDTTTISRKSITMKCTEKKNEVDIYTFTDD